MAVIIAFDLGQKRVGVARSDETETIAEAVRTLSFDSKRDLLRQVKQTLEEIQPSKIIVGFPRNLKGEEGPAAQNVAKVVDWLKKECPGEWIFWDERLTTAEAERILLEADLSRDKRKQIRDRLAAQRILQSYLDFKNLN